MSRFKEDISEAKERMKAWWDHEFIDENWDSLIFGKCEIENCDCECFEGD